MVKNRISRKKVYASIGKKEAHSGVSTTIGNVVGIELVRNARTNEWQKEQGYDTVVLKVVNETSKYNGEPMFTEHTVTLFGKQGVKL